jgi:nitroimidazol reductase NimA-like FMN-containing flavoprotein (pyridoxamine 5'-phosphate oxidase superfamily)
MRHTAFEVLARDECLRLLSGEWRGRVGVSSDALPAILPVSYLLVDRQIVFPSMSGGKLEAIGRGDVVCFEVDHADRAAGTAWSVLVVGRARTVTDPERRAILDAGGADLWPRVDAVAWVQLGTDLVSGRRLVSATADAASHWYG